MKCIGKYKFHLNAIILCTTRAHLHESYQNLQQIKRDEGKGRTNPIRSPEEADSAGISNSSNELRA